MNTHSIILIILIILAALLLLVWLPLFIRSIRKAMKSNNQH